MVPLHLHVVRTRGDSAMARPRRRLARARIQHRSTAQLRLVKAPPAPPKVAWAPYAATLFVLALLGSVAAFAGMAGLSQRTGWVFAIIAGILSFAAPPPRGDRDSA